MKSVLLFFCVLFYANLFSQDGTFDSTFNIGFGPQYFPSKPYWAQPNAILDFEVLEDDRILVFGAFNTINNVDKTTLAILNNDGTVDHSFDTDLSKYQFQSFSPTIDIQKNMSVIICPETGFNINPYDNIDMIKVNFDGTVDTTFHQNRGYGINGQIQHMQVQDDGKIVVVGYFSSVDTITANTICRLNADGTIDNSFIQNSHIWTVPTNTNPAYVRIDQIKILSNRKILLAGYYMKNNVVKYGLFRINEDGTFDYSFENGITNPADCYIYGIDIDSVGNIFMVGSFYGYQSSNSQGNLWGVVKLFPNGQIDNSFSYQQSATDTFYLMSPEHIIVQKDQKILVVSHHRYYQNTSWMVGIKRLLYNGKVDSSFNPQCFFYNIPTRIKLDNQGRILASGVFNSFYGINANNMLRLKNSPLICEDCLTVSTQELQKVINLSLFPNPTSNLLQVQANITENIEQPYIMVYDITGNIVFTSNLVSGLNEMAIDTKDMANGMYILQVRNLQAVIAARQFVVLK